MMPKIAIIEKENFSKWFKTLFYAVFVFYIISWLFTIYLSNIQIKNGLEPVLPVVPKDSEEYKNLADSMLLGRGFYQDGQFDTLRAPGYPTFVASLKYVGGSYFLVTLIQILLVFFSVIIIRRLGAVFYSEKAGEMAGAIFLLNPLVLALALIILTDILFLFLFLLGFYLAFSNNGSKTKIIGAGLLFALAIYVRPMGIFALPIFVAPFLVSKLSVKAKIKSLVAMIFIVLIAVAPWVYRNYKLTGVADFTSFKAINLAFYAAPMFLANQNQTTAEVERTNIANELKIPANEWRNLKYAKPVSHFAERIILEHPFAYLKYHITSSLPFLFSSSIQDALTTYKSAMHTKDKFQPGAIKYLASGEWNLFFESVTAVWWKIAERIILMIIYVVAIWGVWQEKNKLKTWAFLFIPAYLMMLAGPAGGARYAVQALPFILILFAVGLLYIKEKFVNNYLFKR